MKKKNWKIMIVGILAAALVGSLMTACSSTAPKQEEPVQTEENQQADAPSAEETDSQETVVIKYGHNQTEDAPFHAGAVKLQELVEEYSDGTIRVDIYSNAQLGEYFRNRLGLSNGAFVTKADLETYGRTDVTFYKLDEEQYYMDFAVHDVQ